jgi:hypothetical protein
MTWEENKTYLIEAEGFAVERRLTYIGEIQLGWTLERVHVFKAADSQLVGLRDEDITSATVAP